MICDQVTNIQDSKNLRLVARRFSNRAALNVILLPAFKSHDKADIHIMGVRNLRTLSPSREVRVTQQDSKDTHYSRCGDPDQGG